MREIKFRAWIQKDPYDERVAPEMEMAYDLAFDEYLPINDLLAGVEHLMQYTGLKDKNGVEIYEGDIVRYDNGCWNECTKDKCAPHSIDIFAVEWTDNRDDIESGMVGFYLDWSGNEYSPRSIEVIGNIHQNQELLK